MRILLTGYSGFLGRHIARVLKKEGFIIRVLMHKKTVRLNDFRMEADEIVWGSLDDRKVIQRALSDIQGVLHCAWSFSSPSEKRPTINEVGTDCLFQECIQAGIKVFAFISSVAVYGMNDKGRNAITESFSLAEDANITYVYPSEKINIENMLQQKKSNIALGIFRPGPIFDNKKSPAKTIINILGVNFGIGIGGGRNRMAYIHADDVASAVVRWLKSSPGNVIFNITPTKCLTQKEWIRKWGKINDMQIRPLFINSNVFRVFFWGIKIIKKVLGRNNRSDVNYSIACATRDLSYSSQTIKESLRWDDNSTAKYTG